MYLSQVKDATATTSKIKIPTDCSGLCYLNILMQSRRVTTMIWLGSSTTSTALSQFYQYADLFAHQLKALYDNGMEILGQRNALQSHSREKRAQGKATQ